VGGDEDGSWFEEIEKNPYVLPVFRTMDDRGQLPLLVLCGNEQMTPRMLVTIVEPWLNSVSVVDAALNSAMHHLCANRAVTCALFKTLLGLMTDNAAKKVGLRAKKYRHVTILNYFRVWNDRGELPLHRMCANPDVYPELLTTVVDADPLVAGIRDDKGLTPMHHLARNPGCTEQLLDTLFPYCAHVHNGPRWGERGEFVRAGWRPTNIATVDIMGFRGSYHAVTSLDMFGKSVLHHMCRNRNVTTGLIEWLLHKELLPCGTQTPVEALGSCYGPHEKQGPRGRSRYILSRYILHTQEFEWGSDVWEHALMGISGLQPEAPQTMASHRDQLGQTPLHEACESELDPPAREKNKKSMLSGLLTKDTTSSFRMIELLAQTSPGCCGAQDLDDKTPLHCLCTNLTLKAPLFLKVLRLSGFQEAANFRTQLLKSQRS